MRDLIYRDEALNEVAVGKDKNEIQGGILNLPSVEAKELIAKIEIDNDKLTELVEKVKADFLVDYNAGIKAELEEIKAEIGRIETEEGGDFLERPAIDIIYEAQKILDNHINKADCDNDCEHCEWVECPKE